MSSLSMFARAAVVVAAMGVTLFTVPPWWCARGADAWFDGELVLQESLAEGVGRWIDAGVSPDAFSTGSRRFDGEWRYGTHVLSAIGLAQVALAQSEIDPATLERIDRCLDVLLTDEASAFDIESWGFHALTDAGDGHAAWLGYGGLAFALRQRLQPGGRHSETADAIADAIRQRLARMGKGGVETYPGERYPVDQSSLVATLAVWAEARHLPPPPEIALWTALARERFVDPQTGLLLQSVTARGTPLDLPRGSGTFLASYFLSFADPALSASLYEAGRRELAGTFLGFGMMREYPRHLEGSGEIGDIDSGPVILGFGISPTGFALGASRAHRDRATFRGLYATTYLFGAPRDGGEVLRFTTGGQLGDAILLAMLTARPPETP